MLAAPIAIALHRRAPVVMVAVSVTVYLVAQALIIVRIAADPQQTDDGLLKLLSWQLLFFVPMALGARRIHVRAFAWLDGNRVVLALSVALFIAAALARQAQVEPAIFSGCHGLHLLRLAHAMLVTLLYASLLTLARPLLQTRPLRAVGTIGRHSLDCFVAGVVLTYAMGMVWNRAGRAYLLYLALAIAAVVFTAAVAAWRGARKSGRSGTPVLTRAPVICK